MSADSEDLLLKARLLTALLGIPVVILLLWLGSAWWTALVIAALLIAARELVNMYRRSGTTIPYIPVGLAVLTFSVLSVDLGFEELDPYLGETGVIVSLTVLIAYGLVAGLTTTGSRRKTMGIVIFAGLYIGFLGSRLVALRDLSDGFLLVLATLLVVWASDSAAYFIGRKWGSRKLAPYVSPNKSVEGAVAGLIGASVFAVAIFALAPGVITPLVAAVFGLVVGIAAQLGDLFESAIKRSLNVKDSGNLLPGHGGILDRIDSLLFAGAISYYFFWFSGIV